MIGQTVNMITQFAKGSQTYTVVCRAVWDGKRRGRRLRCEQAGTCGIDRRQPQIATPGQSHAHHDGNQHNAPPNDGGTAVVDDGEVSVSIHRSVAKFALLLLASGNVSGRNAFWTDFVHGTLPRRLGDVAKTQHVSLP